MSRTNLERAELRKKLEEQKFISTVINPIFDGAFTKALKELPWSQWMDERAPFDCRQKYLEIIPQWLMSTKLNKIIGLEGYPIAHLVNGTTQAFDEFYFRNSQRRLRIFRGEYAYHRRIFENFKFIDDEPIRSKDFIIMSAPFFSSGNIHPEMSKILDDAMIVGAPVLIDCVSFGSSYDVTLDLTHPAIAEVTFSLTTAIGLGDMRSGVRFSRQLSNGPIFQQNKSNHTVLSAARIGIHMMQKFSPDYIPNKYKDFQKVACEALGITPTNCVHLALGDESWAETYRVDNSHNRIGIRQLVRAIHRMGSLENLLANI